MDLEFLTFTNGSDSSGLSSIEIERAQAIDEGRDFQRIADLYDRLSQLLTSGAHADHQDAIYEFFDAVQELPYDDEFPYEEPARLDRIRELRDGTDFEADPEASRVGAHIDAAWRGRCAGCLLGKPVEGWSRERTVGFLEATGRDPLEAYMRSDVSADVIDAYDVHPGTFVNDVDHMPRDDDIDYTIAGLEILEAHGFDFTSQDVARYWLERLPPLYTYTAERVAYRNLLNLIRPPDSASHRNPYREGIGAQIRADAYGYVAAGEPEHAAAMAYRDATVSHVKNGIYGSMWVAAMVAAAPWCDSPETIVRTGLAELPRTARMTAAIEDVLGWSRSGIGYADAIDRIHERWDESSYYEWLHVIPNAMIVAVGLVYGEGSFGPSICRAVEAGFDADCTGATVGSVMGMYLGPDGIGAEWTEPLGDTVDTVLAGHDRLSISELVQRTLAVSS